MPDSVQSFTIETGQGVKSVKNLAVAFSELGDASVDMGKKLVSAGDATEETAAAYAAFERQLFAAASSMHALEDRVQKGIRPLEAYSASVKGLRAELERLTVAAAKGAAPNDDIREIRRIQDAYRSLAAERIRGIREVQRIQAAAQREARNSAFEKTIVRLPSPTGTGTSTPGPARTTFQQDDTRVIARQAERSLARAAEAFALFDEKIRQRIGDFGQGAIKDSDFVRDKPGPPIPFEVADKARQFAQALIGAILALRAFEKYLGGFEDPLRGRKALPRPRFESKLDVVPFNERPSTQKQLTFDPLKARIQKQLEGPRPGPTRLVESDEGFTKRIHLDRERAESLEAAARLDAGRRAAEEERKRTAAIGRKAAEDRIARENAAQVKYTNETLEAQRRERVHAEAAERQRTRDINANRQAGVNIVNLLPQRAAPKPFDFTPYEKGRKAVELLDTQFKGLKGTLDQISNISFATAIYRSISALTQAIQGSIHDAAEYARQIGLLQTLADDSGESFNTWNAAVQRLSNELGAPAIEVAKAAYAGLSNQVINNTRDFELLATAFKLARTTNSDINNSLNLLSSVIRGFGTTTGDATKIADSFFRTVDIGRVSLDELNQSYGRAANLANTLGASYNELNAGIALITQTGVKATEATTLLNNIFVQLIHPNEALKELFKDLNLETGQAAVAALGFGGALIKIIDAAKGTKEGLATFFPEIRGLRGVSALNTLGLDEYAKTLDKVTNSTNAVADASKILSDNVGFKFQKELEKIKTFFTTDLGQTFLNLVVNVSENFGGLATIVKQATVQVILLTAAVVAFKSVATLASVLKAFSTLGNYLAHIILQTQYATQATGVFAGTSIAAAAPIVAAFALIAGAVYLITKRYYENLDARKAAFATASVQYNAVFKAQVDNQKAASEESLKVFEDGLKKHTAAYTTFIAGIRGQNKQIVESLRETNSKITEGLKNTFDVLIHASTKNVTQLREAQNKAISNIKDIREEQIRSIDEAEKDQYHKQLERLKRLDDFQRERGGSGQTGNILDLVNKRNAFLSQKQQVAFDTGNLSEAAKLQDEMRSNLNAIAGITTTINGRTVERFRTDQAVSDIATQYYYRLEATKKTQGDLVEISRKKANIAEIEAKKLEDVLRKIEKFSVVDSKGDILPKYDKGKLRDAATDLTKLQQEAADLVKNMQGLDDPELSLRVKEIVDQVNSGFAAQQKNTSELIRSLETANLIDISERRSNERADILLQTHTKIRSVLEDQLKVIETQGDGIGGLIHSLRGAIGDQTSKAINADAALLGLSGLGPKIQALKDAKFELDELHRTLGESNIDYEKAIRLTQTIAKNIKSIGDVSVTVDKEGNVESAATTIQTLIGKFQILKDANNAAGSSRADLDEVQKKLDALVGQAEKFTTANADIAKGQGQIIARTQGIDDNAKAMDALARSTLAAAEAQKELNRALAGGTGTTGKPGKVEAKASGGPVGFAGGFLPDFYSGRFGVAGDVIPTMLKRGEIVVREPFAQQFYSQLIAMNAGISPRDNADGTTTYNIPITVTVQGGKASPKDIAKAIRRDLRRGISTL